MPLNSETFVALLTAAGGVALFLYGMELMTEALQRLAGFHVRSLLSRMTRNQVAGLSGGTAAGALIHSGPTTIIVLGFVNAGILSLYQSVGLVYGANIGTTLSMQVVAFDIGMYSYGFLAAGALMRLFSPSWKLQNIGTTVIGVSLLFLGLEAMKTAMDELRTSQTLLDLLAVLGIETPLQILGGLILGLAVTALFQSSGASISLLFSLAALGIVQDFESVIPFVLGAHIGTCAPTILAASRGSRNAWRVALTHVFFNTLGALLGLAMLRVYTWLIPLAGGNTVRQIANFHTAVQVVNALLLLPFAGLTVKLMTWLVPRRENEDAGSYLDLDLVKTPEMAILTVIRELRRQGHIVSQMMENSLDGLVSLNTRKFERVAAQEESVDLIKDQIEAYINAVGERSLSPRQGMMLQRLVISSHALERVADYIESIGNLSRYKIDQDIWFDDRSMQELLELSSLVCQMLENTLESLDPTSPNYRDLALQVLADRKDYKAKSKALKRAVNERMLAEGHEATTGLFFMRYVTIFDRIVDHLRMIARQEKKETYLVKHHKLYREEPLATPEFRRPDDYELPATFEEATEQFLSSASDEDVQEVEELHNSAETFARLRKSASGKKNEKPSS